MDFINKLLTASHKNNSLLCVGLDPDQEKMEQSLLKHNQPLYEFNRLIIDATADLVCAFKPNTAFYEAYGSKGIEELQRTVEYMHVSYPDIPIILDAKRADIGNTNNGSVAFAFNYLLADAITINPYMGKEAVEPFLQNPAKGVAVLCRTSNPGAHEFQDLVVDKRPLYQQVAKNVAENWNSNNNCLLVVGATYPDELLEVRNIIGQDMFLLLPGVGAQGGDIEKAVRAARNHQNSGFIINASRSILYASHQQDFADAARSAALTMRDEINRSRQ